MPPDPRSRGASLPRLKARERSDQAACRGRRARRSRPGVYRDPSDRNLRYFFAHEVRVASKKPEGLSENRDRRAVGSGGLAAGLRDQSMGFRSPEESSHRQTSMGGWAPIVAVGAACELPMKKTLSLLTGIIIHILRSLKTEVMSRSMRSFLIISVSIYKAE